MAIDEMIEFILYFLQGRRNGKNAGLQIIKALKELKWYREQDLIKREDAVETLTQMEWHDEEGYQVEDYEDKKQYAIDWVEQVPKAEPPTCYKMERVDKDINVPRNGDCETCKHYYRQGELTYGFCADCIEKGMGKYEPYIPKEK